jgi:hypothetical protein
LSSLQDYHNIRAAAFNSQVQELAKRTADLTESRSKHSIFFLAGARQRTRDSGRLLSSRAGSSGNHFSHLVIFVDCLLFLIFAGANATLQQHLGEVQTELHAKEEERRKAALERVRLAKKLADQADQHKAELQKLKEAEGALQAEFET